MPRRVIPIGTTVDGIALLIVSPLLFENRPAEIPTALHCRGFLPHWHRRHRGGASAIRARRLTRHAARFV